MNVLKNNRKQKELISLMAYKYLKINIADKRLMQLDHITNELSQLSADF